jgi:hypothetical protein
VPLPVDRSIQRIENRVLVNYASIDGVLAVGQRLDMFSETSTNQVLRLTHTA